MNQPVSNSIYRVIEEIDPDERMTIVMRRISAFLRAGVSQYWAVDAANKHIEIYVKQSSSYPPDFRQTVKEFFAS